MELSEAIEKCRVDDVFLCEGPRPPQRGSLALIGHHLIFSPAVLASQSSAATTRTSERKRSSTGGGGKNDELWLLHRAVDRVLVEPLSRDPTLRQGAFLRLKCKNFMQCCIEFNDLADCQAVARSIETLSNLSGIEHDYPFYYRCPFSVLDDGWKEFGMEQLFSRLQIHSKDKWRISAVNRNFEVCSSYPELVIVPTGIGDDYLRISATFRDNGRFPILCYFHHKTKSSIIRCGQPLIGPTNRRCKEDETILNSFLSAVSKGIIFDTRSKTVAQAARPKGGGCEGQMYYSQWRYLNGSVPRAKEIHDALPRLVEACSEGSPDRWLSKLAGSGWLQFVADTLTGAATIAQCVHCCEEVPVVVHGAEGTDSTLLVTSLAQLLLDSDSRTLRGFQALIEHEWITAGHPFSLRCAHSAYATGTVTGPYEAPVFLCFLDCVWQVIRQYPSAFEFNEQFLIFLFEHAYASEFGTFLGNNEQEKWRYRVKERTVSLWSYVNHPEVLPAFFSSIYEPCEQSLWPSVAAQSIILWERMYLRWHHNWTDFDRAQQKLDAWKRAEKELQSKLLAMGSSSMTPASTMTSSSAASSSYSLTATKQIINKASPAQPKQNANALAFGEMVKLEQLNIQQPSEDSDDDADFVDDLGELDEETRAKLGIISRK